MLEKKKATSKLSSSAKKKPVINTTSSKPLPDFNLDTRPQKYFDPEIDPKAKRDYERERQEREQAKAQRKNIQT